MNMFPIALLHKLVKLRPLLPKEQVLKFRFQRKFYSSILDSISVSVESLKNLKYLGAFVVMSTLL